MSKKKTMEDIAAKKRPLLKARTAAALGVSEQEAERLLRMGRRQSIRINRLKADTEPTIKALVDLGWSGEPYHWIDGCYTVDDGLEAIRDSDEVRNGEVFIQNAASWLPVLLLEAGPDHDVLDVCAAPGGKTSHIAERSDNQARITANDNSRGRLAKLQANCRRLGANVERYTLYDAQRLATQLKDESYDRILLDAPCSGEGLIRFDRDKDFEMWSVAQIKRLQQLQRKLLVQAWQLLRPGGRLVYSTCTMAPEENEQVIDYALRRLDDAELVPISVDLPNRVGAVDVWNGKPIDDRVGGSLRLAPGNTIEAFYVCVLQKRDD